MYNNFAYTICNIACEITQKKKEKNFNKIETTWKSLLQENADKINLIKEKIDLYKKSNSNSIEQFPLDLICAIILAHKYNKLFSNYHFANILITDDYNNIHAKYFPYISSLKYYMDCLIEDLGIDSNIIKNVFYNLVLHNRQEIINKLLSLQCNSQDWLSPFIIKMIYDTISNDKTFDDLEPFF